MASIRTNPASFIVILLSALAAFFILINYSVDDKGIVSTDSVKYTGWALENCDEPLAPLRNVIEGGSLVSLNWSTIVSIGAVACGISREYFEIPIVIFNLLILGVTLNVYSKVMNLCVLTRHEQLKIIFSFLLQLLLIASLPSLNKEVLTYFVISLLALAYLKRSRLMLLGVGICFGLLKVQFFLFALMLVAQRSGIGFWKQLLFLALLMTVLHDLTVIDLVEFYSNYEDTVRTEALTLWINGLLDYPFGFLLVMPIRVTLNLFAGFSPMRIPIMFDDWQAFSYQVNAIFLGIVALRLIYSLIKNRKMRNHPLIEFIFLYCMLISILPFIQTRYLLCLLPIMLVTLLTPNRFNEGRVFDASTVKNKSSVVGGALSP